MNLLMNMNSATENLVIAAELKLRLEKPEGICIGKSAVLGLDSGLSSGSLLVGKFELFHQSTSPELQMRQERH